MTKTFAGVIVVEMFSDRLVSCAICYLFFVFCLFLVFFRGGGLALFGGIFGGEGGVV